MKRVCKNNVIYNMSAHNQPAVMVEEHEEFRLELEDCYGGRLKSSQDVFTKEMWSTVNPATGPVFIAGACPGDVLCVEIMAINIADHAVMHIARGPGIPGEYVEGVETSILKVRNEQLEFGGGLVLPVRPMIGVIGTALTDDPVSTSFPGEHGGNLDCREITAGSRVYLPVNVSGALLSLGDIHALMGDGEVCGCGAEMSGEVVLRTHFERSFMPTPAVETTDKIHFLGSAKTLDECETIVLRKAHAYLVQRMKMSANDAVRFMSLAGDLGVCQVVDPLKTMRFSLPRHICKSSRKDF